MIKTYKVVSNVNQRSIHDINQTKIPDVKTKQKYYAVANGRKVGIFDTWAVCSQHVNGYSNAVHKRFDTRDEAENFIMEYNKSYSKKPCDDLNNKRSMKQSNSKEKNSGSTIKKKSGKASKTVPRAPHDSNKQMLHWGDIVKIQTEGHWSNTRGMHGRVVNFGAGSGENMWLTISTEEHGDLSRKAKNLVLVERTNENEVDDLNKKLSDFWLGKHQM